MTRVSPASTMDGMAANPSNFTVKLTSLLEDRTAKEVAESAGLTAKALYDIIGKGATPRAETCLALAQALDVPVEYLINDKYGPDDAPNSPYHDIPDDVIQLESARRFRLKLLRITEALDLAEASDLMQFAALLFEAGLDDWPVDLGDPRYELAVTACDFTPTLKSEHDPDSIAWKRHTELPGADRDRDELLAAEVDARAERIHREDAGAGWIRWYLVLREACQNNPTMRRSYRVQATEALHRIKRGEGLELSVDDAERNRSHHEMLSDLKRKAGIPDRHTPPEVFKVDPTHKRS